MKKYSPIIAAIGIATALAACGSSEETGEGASSEEASAPAEKLEPGKYEMQIRVLEMELPEIEGIPANAKDMFKSMIEQTTYYCVTPEEAEKGGFEQSIDKMKKGNNCKIERENNTASTLDMAMVCEQDGSTVHMDMKGQLMSDGVKVTMDAEGEMGEDTMSFKNEYRSKRVGECDEETPAEEA